MATAKTDSIWTRTFLLLCAAQFLGYAQHAMLAPTLPLYVTHLGGSPFIVGVVLASFAVTSVLIRPLIGHWADRWNETGVIITGLLFQGATILLCLIAFIPAAMLANGLRGVGWAGLNTGGYSLLAQTAPIARRGEASGYYSGVQSASTLVFPAVALWLLAAPWGGFNLVFVATAILSLFGAIVASLMGRTRSRVSPDPAWTPTHQSQKSLYFVESGILLPSVMLFWLNLAWPALMNFIVLYAQEMGIRNFGSYFIIVGTTNLLARPLLGRVSDRIGRGRSAAMGFALQVGGLLFAITASSLGGIIAAGIVYMLGNAIGSSASLALAVERADPQRRGKAMASFSVAYPLAYGVGSLLTGSAVEITGFLGMFTLLAVLEAAGFIFALAQRANLK